MALKELGAFHASDPAFAERFLREFRGAGSLSHPNIVTVHEYFEHKGTPFIAMEYMPRGSLRPLIHELTLPQIAGVMEGLLAGLAHAASRGIVHRDLKPENLLITAEGRIKIADFGIAKAYNQAATGRFLTATGTTVGTPAYMAPEQAMAKSIGPWTDLYSTGVIAYELMVGNAPFYETDTPMAMLLRHVNDPVPAPRTVKPDLDVRLADWISSLLEKSPSDRPSSEEEAWASLEDTILQILGPRWRREARLHAPITAVSTPEPLTPAPFHEESAEVQPARRPEPSARRPKLSALLREAALTGVVPAMPDTSPPAAVAEPPIVVERREAVQYSIELRVARRQRVSLLPRIAVPLVVLVALAAAAKWLLGWFVESGESHEAGADSVQCTVFAPPSAAPGDSILVQVFVHLPEEADDARAIATELDTEASRRAFRSLEAPVPAGSRLEFELRLGELEIDDPFASLVWRRRTEAVQFGVAVPSRTPTGTVIGTVSVSVDSVPVGHVKFKLAIERHAVPVPSEPQGEDASRYRFAFISYSSRDRDEVLRRVQLLSIVGIRYFQDVLSLEPGDRWLKRIELGIDQCDLFLLFWSSDAKQSDWVRQEVRHALARKGGDDLSPPEIRPVVIEGPPVVEPWEELAGLHFNDRVLYFLSPPRVAPLLTCTACGRTCRACGRRNSVDADFCDECGAYLRWEDTS